MFYFVAILRPLSCLGMMVHHIRLASIRAHLPVGKLSIINTTHFWMMRLGRWWICVYFSSVNMETELGTLEECTVCNLLVMF